MRAPHCPDYPDPNRLQAWSLSFQCLWARGLGSGLQGSGFRASGLKALGLGFQCPKACRVPWSYYSTVDGNPDRSPSCARKFHARPRPLVNAGEACKQSREKVAYHDELLMQTSARKSAGCWFETCRPSWLLGYSYSEAVFYPWKRFVCKQTLDQSGLRPVGFRL